MTPLGDNPDNGRVSLGGLRGAGAVMRGGSARKGIVLYAKPAAFSIVNSAAADQAQRDEARYGGGGAQAGIVRVQQR